jgi:hypothetical protein
MSDRPAISGARLGSLIGVIAGATFIFVNAGQTTAAAPVRFAGLILFVGALQWGVLRAPASAAPKPSASARRTYLICVAAEVAAIPLGAAIITQVFERPELTVLWVVAVVGMHFIPFSSAFGEPVFRVLGATLILLAAIGALVSVVSGSDSAPAWFAVTAGVVLLASSVVGPRLAATANQI